jgi:hypothetical protein
MRASDATANPAASGWSTSNTKLAAVFAGLGFPVETRATEILERKVSSRVRYYIGDASTRNSMRRDYLRNAWETGDLEKADPLHPFLVGLAAVANYERLMIMQSRGERYRLVSVPGGWEYRQGEEDARLMLAQDLVQTTDLPLAAALGAIGVPVVRFDGSHGQRRYVLPNRGLDLVQRPCTELMRRAVAGKLDLELERTEPQHPLCAAYQATYSLGRVNAHLKRQLRCVVLKAPGSQRRALVTEHATNRVLDKVQKHFGIPD